jgi:DNA gyrase/topoisomerase IV subunit A
MTFTDTQGNPDETFYSQPAHSDPKPLFSPALPASRDEQIAVRESMRRVEADRRELMARLNATPPPVPEEPSLPEPKLSELMATERRRLRAEMAELAEQIHTLKAQIAAEQQ